MDAKLTQTDVKKVYNSLAWIYDVWGKLTETQAKERALNLANIKNGQAILEVALGTGFTFKEIVSLNADGLNVGIDISDKMIQLAEKRISKRPASGKVELKQASAFDIPYPEQTFDLILNCYMLDLIPFAEMGSIMTEFHRLLKPGGKLALTNMTSGKSKLSHFYGYLSRLSPKLMGGCRPVDLKEMLVQHDFEVKTQDYVEQFFFPSEILLAVKCSTTHRTLM